MICRLSVSPVDAPVPIRSEAQIEDKERIQKHETESEQEAVSEGAGNAKRKARFHHAGDDTGKRDEETARIRASNRADGGGDERDPEKRGFPA